MSDLHRIPESYIPVNRGSQNAPPQRILRVDEVESRGWGRRAPQSPSSSSFGAPQGNNKIYKSDEVFLIEESNTNDISKTPFPYNKSKEYQQTQFDKQTQLDKQTASYSTNPPTAGQNARARDRVPHQRAVTAINRSSGMYPATPVLSCMSASRQAASAASK